MHKYQPRIHVICKDFSSDLSPTKPVPTGDGVKTFHFPETVFTTVTAYQNQQVIKNEPCKLFPVTALVSILHLEQEGVLFDTLLLK